MRVSRILVGVIFIVLIAWGIIWLEEHGYFNRPVVTHLGMVKSDNPPTPAPDTTAPNNTPQNPTPTVVQGDPDAEYAATRKEAEDTYRKEEQDEALGRLPIGTARADYESTMRKAEADRDLTKKVQGKRSPSSTYATPSPAPATTAAAAPAQPAWPRGAVADVNGNPCIPIKARPAVVVHHWHHHYATPAPAAPRYAASGQMCPLMRSNPDGTHTVTLPAGMLLNASIDHELSTSLSRPGEGFTAYLVGPVTYCGHVVIPAGSSVQGTVGAAFKRSAFSSGDSTLELRLQSLQANGYNFQLSAGSITQSNSSDMPLRSVTYDNGGNGYSTVERTGRNIDFPAQSVVSFWLQSPATVTF